MHNFRLPFALFCALAAVSLPVSADVTLPAIISDNMVLQQKGKVSVWGKAEPKEQVTVKIAGRSASATANADGAWSVKFEWLKAGGPYDMTVAGKNTITVKNVAVGEVWVASGQSNMEFRLSNANNAKEEMEKADHPMIRMFTVKHKSSAEPETDCEGQWMVCAPGNVTNFSAAAYFFARELNQKLKVPVGVIHSSWGGTPAEAWTPKAALEADDTLKQIFGWWQKLVENSQSPKAQEQFEKKQAEWKDAAAKAKADGKTPPPAPRKSPGADPKNAPAGLYNGMIAPIIPYSIKGVIWYQGESNATRAVEYRTLFPAMIKSWRKAWGNEMPFGFVQLANFMRRQAAPADSNWAMLREAQTMTLKLPKTGMAVIIDIGMGDNIHPTNKQDVGHRLALWAEANVYSNGDTYSGPMFSSMKVAGDKATISFQSTGGGLVAKDGPLTGFAIAGEDMNFVWAEAKISGSKVVVNSPSVSKPVAVRYAWADNPACNLYNKAGLPASPFRTDKWEHTTGTIPSAAAPAEKAAEPEKAAPGEKPLSSEKPAKDLAPVNP